MKLKLTVSTLVATLVLSSCFSLISKVQARPPVSDKDSGVNSSIPVESPSGSETAEVSTQFSCVARNDGSVATVGQRPDIEPIPLILWTPEGSKNFGDKYSPQQRCNIVTPKLNKAVANSGGSLQNVILMTGKINKATVICVVSGEETGCNSKNVLFTLKPENAKDAKAILAQLIQIGREGSSAGVVRETAGRGQFNLGKWEKENIRTTPAKNGNL